MNTLQCFMKEGESLLRTIASHRWNNAPYYQIHLSLRDLIYNKPWCSLIFSIGYL